MTGAAGSLLCEVLVDTDTVIVDITKTISDLVDRAFEVSSEEYSALVGQIRGKTVTNITLFHILSYRGRLPRQWILWPTSTTTSPPQFLDKVTQTHNARNIYIRLNPSKDLLFGGKLGDMAKHLKDSSQVPKILTMTTN